MRIKRKPLSTQERETLATLRQIEDRNPVQQQSFEQLSIREDRYGHECPEVLRDILRF